MATALDNQSIITVQISLLKGSEPYFIDWQGKLNHLITSAPGFISLEISSGVSKDGSWVITQRFCSAESAAAWRNSPQFVSLIRELDQSATKGGIVFSSPIESALGFVTEVFVTDVTADHISAFNEWSARIHHEEAKHPGFRGVYVQSPIQSKGKHWITMLQFDTVEHLDKWLDSPERKVILSEPHPWLSTLESHRVISPYGGWFTSLAKTGNVPPAWKQTMLVLMILFPVVMLMMKYLNPLTANLNSSLALFISNVMSVTFIAYPGMPLAIKLLDWWLMPTGARERSITFWGTVLVIFIYICEVALFWNFL